MLPTDQPAFHQPATVSWLKGYQNSLCSYHTHGGPESIPSEGNSLTNDWWERVNKCYDFHPLPSLLGKFWGMCFVLFPRISLGDYAAVTHCSSWLDTVSFIGYLSFPVSVLPYSVHVPCSSQSPACTKVLGTASVSGEHKQCIGIMVIIIDS